MPPQQLRDYQARGLAQILDAWRGGARSVLAVAPTGSGKTTLFGHLTAQLRAPVLINVHRRELAAQASKRLREFGVDHGVIMAGEPRRTAARVQVASIQTLVRRSVPPAGLVINDEAHLSTANSWQKVLDEYPRARILGVTATPWRLSGKPLASAYDAVVVIATPRELRQQGHLCPYVGFSYRAPDLSKVKTTGGDYNEQQSAEAMSDTLIVDNIVEQWGKHARDLSTVVFAVTVEHSKQLVARFKAAGVAAEHLDGTTPAPQRAAILARVERGITRVLCNVGVAIEGLDIPRLKCCVLARPTKSLARALQMQGRVFRPWNGVAARIHDHAFVIKQHGLPDDDRDYALNAMKEAPPPLTTCEVCLAVYYGPRCTACSHENAPRDPTERVIATVDDAEQWEFTSDDKTAHVRVERPPVHVQWNSPGRVLEGTMLQKWVETDQYGPRKWYMLRGKKRDYKFSAPRMLHAALRSVQIPDSKVRITYTGERELPGGRRQKLFRVQVDDGQ